MPESPKQELPSAVLDQLFRTARSYNAFAPDPIDASTLRRVYELAKWGATATNSNPARFVFLATPAARARLSPFMSSANRAKTLAAPVNVIMAYDVNFADNVPSLFPHNPGAAAWFADPAVAREAAFRNGTLQAAYLMLAARSLGLDCGPMSGFNADGVNEEFFKGTSWRVNFICNLGRGANENLFPRLPRLAFEDACRIL